MNRVRYAHKKATLSGGFLVGRPERVQLTEVARLVIKGRVIRN